MAERTVKLEDAEWQQVMNALIATNQVLMKIGAQLREQTVEKQTNSQEVPVPQGEVVSRRTN